VAGRSLQRGLRAVAVFEALKGALALLAAAGFLYFIPRNLHQVAAELVGRLHLNAGKRYPNIFNRLIDDLSNAQLWAIATLVVVYAALRFAEAYGLWRGREWAEWLAAVSGAIYVPFELYELSRGISWIKLAALAANLAIVTFMVLSLRSRSTGRRAPSGS